MNNGVQSFALLNRWLTLNTTGLICEMQSARSSSYVDTLSKRMSRFTEKFSRKSEFNT
ncbi:hypothetical protein PUN28_000254 [Cardiocondyla obscurior]|uniref:Uncharacterized protein n=1 Tax=Cardiocondyla obscurior TaxID=286306 RepID=A0AAW2GYJ6_9HYME